MIIRRVMLETRQYVFRDNIYYTLRTLLQRRATLRAGRLGDDPVTPLTAAPVQLASSAGAGISPAVK